MKRLKKKEPYSELFGSDSDDDDEEDEEDEEKQKSKKDKKEKEEIKEEAKKEEKEKPKRQLGVRCVRLTYVARPTHVRLQNHHPQLEVPVPLP